MKTKWMAALMTALVMTGCRTFTGVDEKSALQDFQSTDPIVREAARMKLEKSGSKRAIDAMGTAYATAVDSNWKLALINGLGAIKKPEIIHYLLPMPEDANLAAATAKALSGLGTAETTKVIIDYFDKSNTLTAGLAMIDEAEALLAQGNNHFFFGARDLDTLEAEMSAREGGNHRRGRGYRQNNLFHILHFYRFTC